MYISSDDMGTQLRRAMEMLRRKQIRVIFGALMTRSAESR